MELSQLKYFRELGKIENLKKASEKLNISVPALSASIAKLEKYVGCALFTRSPGKALKLNVQGKILLVACEQIVNILDNAVVEIRQNKHYNINSLSVGVISPLVLNDCLITFRQMLPEVLLFHSYIDLWHLSDLDFVKKFDFIVAAPDDIDPNVAKEMEWEYLYRDDYPMLLVYPEHPFARMESVDIADLADQPFVMVNRNLSSRRMADEFFRQVDIKPRIVFEVDYYMREKIILEGAGIGFSTYQVKLANPRTGLVFVPIRNHNYCRQQAIWWYKRRPLSVVAKEFKEFAVQFYKDSVRGNAGGVNKNIADLYK